MSQAPDIRLAVVVSGRTFGQERTLPGPDVRLAHVPGAQGDNVLAGRNGHATMPEEDLPAILVSYFYLRKFWEERAQYRYRDWVLDSGAFSAANSGVEIDVGEYTDRCLELMEGPDGPTEIYALDVIGDHEGTQRNLDYMRDRGVPAIPAFHIGSPSQVLRDYAASEPKVGIGGVAKARGNVKRRFIEQVFTTGWPCRFHGFGIAKDDLVLGFPWHSVDATSWEISPCGFGTWKKFGKMSVRGGDQDLRTQVEHYLGIEKKARILWKRELAELERTAPPMTAIGSNQQGTKGKTS